MIVVVCMFNGCISGSYSRFWLRFWFIYVIIVCFFGRCFGCFFDVWIGFWSSFFFICINDCNNFINFYCFVFLKVDFLNYFVYWRRYFGINFICGNFKNGFIFFNGVFYLFNLFEDGCFYDVFFYFGYN